MNGFMHSLASKRLGLFAAVLVAVAQGWVSEDPLVNGCALIGAGFACIAFGLSGFGKESNMEEEEEE